MRGASWTQIMRLEHGEESRRNKAAPLATLPMINSPRCCILVILESVLWRVWTTLISYVYHGLLESIYTA